jgi:DNA-binding response OmpR family regulator
MAVAKMHHYIVQPADVDELLARRAALITAVRAAYPGLTETRLIRLEDGTFSDTWRWDTAEHMRAASPATSLPEARAAMSLVRDHSARNGEVLDER